MLFNTDGNIKIIQLKQNREFKRKEENASELAYIFFYYYCLIEGRIGWKCLFVFWNIKTNIKARMPKAALFEYQI